MHLARLSGIGSCVFMLATAVLQLSAQRGGAPALPGARSQGGRGARGGARVRQLRASLLNNVLQETPHSSRAETLCTEFIAARVMAPICAVASREGPIFCAPK